MASADQLGAQAAHQLAHRGLFGDLLHLGDVAEAP